MANDNDNDKGNDKFMEAAILKQQEAISLLENVEASAEEVERAENLMIEAKSLSERSSRLQSINADMMSAFKAQKETEEIKLKQDRQTQSASGFRHMGEFCKAVMQVREQGLGFYDPRLQYMGGADESASAPGDVKAMVERVGADGGFLVPIEYQAQLRALAAELSIVRDRATVIPMSRRQMQMPVVDQTGTTAGKPHQFGGIYARWTEEASDKTEDSPQFKLVTLTAHKLALITYSSDELLDDSAIALDAFLTGPMGFPGVISWQEDYTFIQGTGAGQPLGVIPAPATITVARAAAAAVGYADLCNMRENFLPSGSGVWLINQSLMSDMLQLNGPAGNASFIWGSAVEGAPNRLLGFPVIWTEKNPTIGNAGDVILADWAFYLIGDRQNTTIDTSMHNRFESDETTWRAVHRVDGRPWLSAPLTLQDGTQQVSPFVILGDKDT